MDQSVKWSVDPVRWRDPRIEGQSFRVTPWERILEVHKILWNSEDDA